MRRRFYASITPLLMTALFALTGRAQAPAVSHSAAMSSSSRVAVNPATSASAAEPSGSPSAPNPFAETAQPSSALQEIADATIELDVERARRLLERTSGDSRGLSFERARLAIYIGDCDTAAAILGGPSFADSRDAAGLADLAKSCAQATAASIVVEDAAHGVWIRLQDEADRAFVPLLVNIADAARATLQRDLGAELPRPLRIELVRDLFSLSALTGLPVSAAETTGTVAVARWGRVTMLSPRAALLGYPWQDTLAHEITHLALTRITRDRAPLWLQEGIAKRQETRWREPRPFDEQPAADEVVHNALMSGRYSVNIGNIGPSIALLQSPEEASFTFAEVTSFVRYFIEQNGEPALKLLFLDLRGIGERDPDSALRSVTGFGFEYWVLRWKEHVLAERPTAMVHGRKPPAFGAADAELMRRVRLGDLLLHEAKASSAVRQFTPAVEQAKNEPGVRARAARALLEAGREKDAEHALGETKDLSSAFGPWLGLYGRVLRSSGDEGAADRTFRHAIALDPLSEEAACEGQFRAYGSNEAPPVPNRPDRRALCEAARHVREARDRSRE